MTDAPKLRAIESALRELDRRDPRAKCLHLAEWAARRAAEIEAEMFAYEPEPREDE